jgi:YbbR domain-containing protein
MVESLRKITRNLPTLFFAFALALTVWVTSVTQADPSVKQAYPHPISVTMIGLDPGSVLTSVTPSQVTVTIDAPRSVWTELNGDNNLVTAVADLSSLTPGTHSVPVQVSVSAHPSNWISTSPKTISVTLEKLTTRTLPVHIVTHGEAAAGYQAAEPSLKVTSVNISGPTSLAARVAELRATLDITDARDSIDRTIVLQALDSSENVVEGVTLNPDRVEIQEPITQRYGFRTVSVKVMVTGQVVNGYRVTNISVSPPAVTVSSSNPQSVNDLPGYVETIPVNLDGIKSDIDVRVPLNLPSGVKMEGDQTILVQVGIAAIESSLTISNLAVQSTGLVPGLAAHFSPATVDIILSGPLPLLVGLNGTDVQVIVDLSGKGAGSYQVTPTVEINSSELRVVSIQPGTVEVTITAAPLPTPTRKP